MRNIYIVLDITDTELGTVWRVFDNEEAANKARDHMMKDPEHGQDYEVVSYTLYSEFDPEAFERGE